jgi:aspartate/methionine/tyrosine aminotransferase
MQLATAMSRLGTESAFEVLARAKRLQAAGQSIVNLGIGSPDFRTPEHIVEAGCKALRDGAHFYTPAKGLPELRQAVAEENRRLRGVAIDPEQVVIVSGGKPTMFFAIAMFGEPGVEILYPNPGFPIYESLIRWSGATPVPMRLSEENGFSFQADAVLAKITPRTRLIIVNTPANPTGGVVPRAELDKLARGLEAHPQVAILSDEIYGRMTYDGEEHVSLLSYPAIAERVIVLDGWSKTFSMTGWRLGYGVWPRPLVAEAERLQINTNSCASAPVQWAGIAALRGPQEPVHAMMKAFDERRRAIVDGLNEIPGFSCVLPKGAFYAFPNVTGTGIRSKELEKRLLEKAGVAILSGTAFGQYGEGYLRFSYAASLADIREALRRVTECLQPA